MIYQHATKLTCNYDHVQKGAISSLVAGRNIQLLRFRERIFFLHIERERI